MNLFRLFPMILVACTIAQTTVAQVNDAARSVQSPNPPSQSENLFAIIGQVARPGVYRAPLSNPYLVDLLNNAGGFLGKANGNLLITRQTSDGTKSFFATGRDFQLQEGDVVIAGRQFEPTIAPQSVATQPVATQPVAAEPTTAPVQLAFLNLANRPVVLKMRPEMATVGKILELLGHSPTLASTVRVIAATETPQPTTADMQLTAESVLVFDPRVMQANLLPELPMTIANETKSVNQTITKVHSEASPEVAAVSVEPEEAAVTDQAQSPVVPPAYELEPPSLTEEPVTISTTDQQSIPPVQTASLPPRSAVPELPDDLLSSHDPLAPPNESVEEAGEEGWLSTVMYWLFSLVTLVGSSWGALRYKKQRGRKQSAQSPIGAVVGNVREYVGNRLDEIINDRLPVVEETVAPAKQAVQHSQSTREQSFRVDAAHTAHRPHIRPHAAPMVDQPQTPEPVVAARSAEATTYQLSTAAEKEPVRKPLASVIRSSEKEPEGLLDRVLSRVHGASHR